MIDTDSLLHFCELKSFSVEGYNQSDWHSWEQASNNTWNQLFQINKMAGEISQKLKVKTTKELTEQMKSLCDAHALLVKKVNMLQTEVKETKEELKIWKKQCESKKRENQFKCTLCSGNFSDKGLLKRHCKENHGTNFSAQTSILKFLKSQIKLLLNKNYARLDSVHDVHLKPSTNQFVLASYIYSATISCKGQFFSYH